VRRTHELGSDRMVIIALGGTAGKQIVGEHGNAAIAVSTQPPKRAPVGTPGTAERLQAWAALTSSERYVALIACLEKVS